MDRKKQTRKQMKNSFTGAHYCLQTGFVSPERFWFFLRSLCCLTTDHHRHSEAVLVQLETTKKDFSATKPLPLFVSSACLQPVVESLQFYIVCLHFLGTDFTRFIKMHRIKAIVLKWNCVENTVYFSQLKFKYDLNLFLAF